MKKILFIVPIVALLAASCNIKQEETIQTPTPTPIVQNTNPTPTPSNVPAQKPIPTTKPTISDSGNSTAIEKLIISVNDKVASGTVTVGSSNALVGSYIVSNPTSENITISNFSVIGFFSGTKLFVNGVQLGSLASNISSTANFSPAKPFTVAAKTKVTVDIHADIVASQFLSVGSLLNSKLDVCTGFGSTYPTYHCIEQTGQTMQVAQ